MNELSLEQVEIIQKNEFNGLLYTYTPMCGTCEVASRMLTVIEELFPTIEIVKMNVNFYPELAEEFRIESVPCLLIMKNGAVEQKIYAFRSVPYLFEKIKQVI
jgi:thioredoxin 1